MTTTDLSALEAEMRGALRRGGWRARELVLISPLGAGKGMRYAFRVATDDGRLVKARHFETADAARRVEELRRGLDEAFAPVLGRYGAVLIEEWVAGAMLDAAAAEAWTHAAGALLGRLHARPLERGRVAEESTARWTEAAAADLAYLRRAEALPASQGETLGAALRHADPGRARVAVIHKDFCAENMLIDAHGRLRIIDTELIAVDPIGFDIGWTWHRWPMSPHGWAQFLDGYRSAAPAPPDGRDYWRIVAGLTLARVFAQRVPARLGAQLARLRHCIAAEDSTPR